jgi:predicted acylesterase/phospholipase RssA
MKSLVLGGGGAFGSFEAGVLYTIFDKIEFDKIYGTSVGGLNAVLMAQAYLNGNPGPILSAKPTTSIKRNGFL